MGALPPAEGRRLPVVSPAIAVIAVAALGAPLLISGLVEASVPTRADSLRLTGAVGAFTGYAGLALSVGIVSYALLLHRSTLDHVRVRTAITAGWSLGLTGAISTTLVAAANAAGTRISALGPNELATAAYDPTFRAKAAAVAMWAVAGFAVVALRTGGAAAFEKSGRRIAMAVLAFGLIRLMSVTADKSLISTTTSASLVHLTAMTLWLGGLATLVLELGCMSPRDLRRVLPRFSRLAFLAVTAIVASGVALTLSYVAAPADLVGTAYGRLLIAKVALLGGILVAARHSQQWVVHRLSTNPPSTSPGPTRTLLCAVSVEITLAVGVLGVAAALVTAPGG